MIDSDNGTAADGKATRDRALFDRIAESYARKDLFPASAEARRMRLEQTLGHKALSADIDVLEVGCGAGYAAQYLSGHYRSYTGIDYSEELIRYAKAKNSVPGASFEAADLYSYDPGRQFDVVYMIGVLHHMTDMPAALQKLVQLVRPGGVVAANEPQPSNPIIHALRKLRVMLDSSYSAEQVELTADEAKKLFRDAGLADVTSIPQGFCSTPFAEVVLKPNFVFKPLSSVACYIDEKLERSGKHLLQNWSWNLIVSGTKSDSLA
jgi:2-polyprenyl-3-methyl-5-hydroxy-6-metoxy-1,4-benzoquinol methylase